MKLNHKNCRPLMWVLFAAGVVCCLLTSAARWWGAAAAVLFIAAIAVNFVGWRCPHCGQRLPGKLSRNEDCPHCGRSLF